MGSGGLPRFLVALALVVGGVPAHPQGSDPVAPYRSANEAFLRNFRVTGAHDPTVLRRNLPGLQSLAETASGELRARALIEIAFIERVSNAFAQAADTYTQAADLAARLGNNDIQFDGWIGVARSQGFANNHGSAADALERAIAAAGAHPTPKQRYDATAYSAELAAARGEFESSLVGALDAMYLAPSADDRFYAELDAGSALESLAESCDYRPLHDSRSKDDPAGESWGACLRALAAAETAYLQAARTADGLGWRSMVSQMQETVTGRVRLRRQLLAVQARNVLDPQTAAGAGANFASFTPHSIADVLVLKGDVARNHLRAAPTLQSLNGQLFTLLDQTIADAVKAQGRETPATLAMRGDLENARTGDATRAVNLFTRASEQLMTERASFFDPRRRGTVVERQGGLLAKLALTLLAQKQDDAAFTAFELGRARGLGELTEILARSDVALGDRAWLAQQVKLDAEASAAEQKIVESVMGEGRLERSAAELTRWEAAGHARQAHLLQRLDLRDRFARSSFAPARLQELQRATSATGIPVLLYWVEHPNIYAWYVGPHGSDFRIVFLPVAALRQKIQQLQTISDESGALNEAVARQLYLYLIAPFADVLDAKQLIVVPQGELLDVPFEVLIDPGGHFLIEQRIISYAPNASAALRSLLRPVPAVRSVTAIVDPEIDDSTHETKGIGSLAGMRLRVLGADDVVPGKLVESLRGAEAAHILLHGRFNAAEPLLSALGGTVQDTPGLVAADFLAIPLRGTKLVVMSACESAELQHRVSNEIYGFPWVLLAAGAENVVSSRWRVNGASNSEWMRSFYAAVGKGASPAEAAADAMRAMLRANRASAYHWAAMQVDGR